MNNSPTSDDFLLKEYDSALRLTYHIDELRAKLTSFYVTFSGIAGAGLIMLLKGEAGNTTGFIPEEVVSVLMCFVGLIGLVIVGIVARLRRAQLEHFRIINNIRTHFLREDIELWNVVELSAFTLPAPNRKSGSYMWVFLIMLIASFFLAFSTFIYTHLALALITATISKWLSLVLFAVFLCVYDRVYMILAAPMARRNYSVSQVSEINSSLLDR